MKNFFIYSALILVIASLVSAGTFSSYTFQEQKTSEQTTTQPKDTAKSAKEKDEAKGLFTKVWDGVKKLFQKKKEKPVKPNENIEKISVHYNDLLRYEKYGAQSEAFWDSLWSLSRTFRYSEVSRNAAVEVFGWHPYWMGSAYQSYNFKLLSSISYFSYELNPETGSYLTVNDWKTTRLVDRAKAAQCKVFLTVTNFGEEANRRFFKNHIAQKKSIEGIIEMVQYRKADGVTLDFELIPKDVKEAYNSYVIELSNQLKTKKLQLNVVIPPVDVNLVYDFSILANYADRFVMLGYGYYGKGSKTAGPNAPLQKGKIWGNSTLQQSVETYLKDGIPAQKLIVSLPYVGTSWKTKTATVPSASIKYLEQLPYRTIKTNYPIPPVLETQSASFYYLFPDFSDGTVNQVWFDDVESLSQKYKFVLSKKLKGAGIWALGYDNGYGDLWNLLETTFGMPVSSPSDSIPSQDSGNGNTPGTQKDSLQQLQQKWKDSILAQVDSLVRRSPSGVTVLPDTSKQKTTLKKKVFGWHPYWNDAAATYQRYQFNLLSAVSYFSYEINPADGSAKSMHDWATTPLVDIAKQNNCKVYLTVSNLTREGNTLFLSNLKTQQQSIPPIIEAVKLRKANGVTLNFENVPGGLSHYLSLYVLGLSNALKAEGLELNVTIPAIDSEDAYPVEALIHHVDQFIMMGYNYYAQGSTVAGPEAPLKSGSLWTVGNLEESVATYLKKGIPKNQLILALPYYGSVWDTPISIIPSEGSSFVKHITYADVRRSYVQSPMYDTIGYTAYYLKPNTAAKGYTQTWFDNEQTLSKKYDMALTQDLAGVGIWALGYDDGFNDLWNVLEKKFVVTEQDKTDTPQDVAAEESFLDKLKKLISLVRVSQNIIFLLLVVILFVFAIGLLLAMTNSKVIETFMSNKAFQVAFISIFLASFIAIFRMNSYIKDSELLFIVGGIIGAISIYLLQKIIIKRMNQKP